MRLFRLKMASKKSVPPNNIRTDADEKQQTAAFPIVNFEVPQVGVFDAPLRYYPVNKEWCKLVTGALELYAQIWSWTDAEDESDMRIQAALQIRKGFDMIIASCEDVEACLGTSTTIGNLETQITINSADIASNSDSIQSNTQTIADNQAASESNVYPALPTAAELDKLCGSSWRIANELNDFIAQTLSDAQTITLDEFLGSLLQFGSWQASTLKLFWDFAVSNWYSGLDADVAATVSTVAEYIYCNEIDMDAVKTQIDNDGNLSATVQAAWIGAIDAITDAKISLWAYLGSLDTTSDCSSFGCLDLWCHLFDFSLNDGGWSTNAEYSRDFGYWDGTAWVSEWGNQSIGYDERLYIDWTYDNPADTIDVEIVLDISGTMGSQRKLTLVCEIGGATYAYPVTPEVGVNTYQFNVQRSGMTKVRFSVVGDSPSQGACTIKCTSVKLSGNHVTNASNGGNNCP